MTDEIRVYGDEDLVKECSLKIPGEDELRLLYLSVPSGKLFNERELAMWEACTHITCDECGEIHKKAYTCCDSCRRKHRRERYDALPAVEWDGDEMIYSDDYDVYFNDEDELEDFCAEHETNHDAIFLHPCSPSVACFIDDDYWSDQLPESNYLDDVAPDLAKMVAAVNDYIIKNRPVLSWMPDFKKRVIVIK